MCSILVDERRKLNYQPYLRGMASFKSNLKKRNGIPSVVTFFFFRPPKSVWTNIIPGPVKVKSFTSKLEKFAKKLILSYGLT